MNKHQRVFARSNFISYLYIPLTLIFLEVTLLFMTKGHVEIGNFIAMLLASIAWGMLTNLVVSLSHSEQWNAWLGLIFIELFSVVFMIAYFVQDSYQNFVNIATVFGGAGGVVEEFGDSIINIIKHNLLKILIWEIPAILYLFLGIIFKVIRFRRNQERKAYFRLFLIFAVFEAAACGLTLRTQNNRTKLVAEYDFNTVVRCFNLQTAVKLDLAYLVLPNPAGCVFLPEEAPSREQFSPDEYHVMDLDLASLSEETKVQDVRNINDYVSSLEPAAKNQYTGLFEGKNIIFISVESMSQEMISEQATPTLYMMQQEGIRFEDYYQPYWNGSTSTGEFSNLLGIIPTRGMYSYENTIGKNLYFTIGNEMMRKGYFSRAYHNGTVEYYQRYIVHPNLGYEKFIADGNGMEEGLSGNWPVSDLEMLQYATPQFIGESPFSIYFMSISGHFPYFHDLSIMVEKYGDRTKDMGYSDYVDAYICSQIDLDEAMKYLLEELKKAGVYEDTVIVLAPDHYPYGLTHNDAWGTDKNYLPELYGFEPKDMMERDHNGLIIWSPVLKDMDPIVVSEPSYSVDILPTLLNLFGVEYDSRLLVGQDLLSPDRDGLVIWPDYSWRTAKGTYYALTNKFVSADGSEPDKEYLK